MRVIPLVSALLAASVVNAEAPAIPRKAPELVLNFVDGSQKLLSSYRGKVIALEFLHTTCPHCQHASQVFSKLNTEYGAKGFQPIGVAWNDMAKMLVPDFIKTYNVNYPVAYADRDTALNYLGYSPMERSVVPQIIWIDRKGMIRSQTPAIGDKPELLQEDYWRKMIDKLTAETDGAKKPVHSASAKKRVQ